MNTPIEQVIEFLEKNDWSHNVDEAGRVVRTTVTGKNGQWMTVAGTDPDHEHLLFLSIFPCRAPEEKRQRCAELFTRINYSLKHGCFEMDFDDGEIRLRTSLIAIEDGVNPEMIEGLIYSNLTVVDQFFKPIMQVLYGDKSPKSALEPEAVTENPHNRRFELN